MEEKKNKMNWKVIVNLITIVILVVCLVKLNNLTNEINNLQSQLSYWQSDVDNIRSDISSIYDNVDAHLKKEASLLSHVDYKLGELDSSSHKAAVHLKVVPKNIAEDLQLSVSLGEESVAFVKKDNEYTASLLVNIFLDYGERPMLHMQTAEGIMTELLESVDLSYIYYKYLPVLESDISGSTTYRNGTLAIDGNVLIDCTPSSPSCNTTIVKAELITEKNGKEIDRKDITSKMQDDYCDFTFKKEYKVDSGEDLAMYLEVEDSAGYVHRSTKRYWLEKGESTGHATEDVHILGIYDKEGNLLNKFE